VTSVVRGDRPGWCPDYVDGLMVPPQQGPWSLTSVQNLLGACSVASWDPEAGRCRGFALCVQGAGSPVSLQG